MDSMSVAVSALNAAKLGIDVTGNNIANAATEGYHRQRLELVPMYSSESAGFVLGGGVAVSEIGRLIDNVLEDQITAQTSLAGQANTELDTLNSIETAFGEMGGEGGFNASIDNFFSAFQKLSADPTSRTLQTEVLNTADTMASQFRTLGDFMTSLSDSIVEKSQATVTKINDLTTQIASLNSMVQENTLKGATTNNLRDQRDAKINELAGLVGIDTVEKADGVVDVNMNGSWLVVGEYARSIQLITQPDGKMGVGPTGTTICMTDITGGELGGYMSLNNTSVADIKAQLDGLAKAVADTVNSYHVQGTGVNGSFNELTGSSMASETLSDWDPPVTAGDIYVRVTDTATGEIVRTRISVDPASDTLSTVAAKLDAISGIGAEVRNGRLSIAADNGYEFDFAPAMGTPPASSFTGTLAPSSISGVYTGTSNDTWTVTVVGSGEVGNCTTPLTLRITDSDGNPIGSDINVGSGYVPGTAITLPRGLSLTLNSATLTDGDSFTMDVVADSDTSGFLAAAGINTFFSGNSAQSITLSDHVADSPSNIATSLGTGETDNLNAKRMAGLKDANNVDLDGTSISGYYRGMVTSIGQEVSLKDARLTSIDSVMQTLKTQREDRSGVDINDEAAQMLIYQQMFQASAKYLTTVQSTMEELMKIL